MLPLFIVFLIVLVSGIMQTGGSDSSATRLAQAIANQEGFNVAGSLAQRNNNPGNLTDPSTGEFRVFSTVTDGFAALERQVQAMLDGTSSIYSPDMTFTEVANEYTATQQSEWAANVSRFLGLLPSDPIGKVAG